MTSKRDQLSQWTTLVADSGDLDAIRASQPQDATTNPSLLLSVAKQPQYQHLLKEAKRFARQLSSHADINLLCDTFATATGVEILKNIPSLVDRKSTRLNSSHVRISYAVFCLKKKKKKHIKDR